MALEIEKRTRVSDILEWSDWAVTTDASPFENTDLVEYRVATAYVIDISDVTSNVTVNDDDEVVGDGIFDTLMATITRHVAVQHEEQRITGEDYANVYLGLTQTALTQSMDFAKSSQLLEIQMANAAQEGLNLEKEVPLKLLSTQVGAWTSVFNSGKVDNTPTLIDDEEILAVYNDVKEA